MNKLLLTAGIAMTTLLGASAMIPQTVQGRPYAPAKGKCLRLGGLTRFQLLILISPTFRPGPEKVIRNAPL